MSKSGQIFSRAVWISAGLVLCSLVLFHLIAGVAAAYLMFPGMFVALIASVVFSGHSHGGWSLTVVTLVAILINFPCYLAVSYALLFVCRKRA
jgi:hypothetical protein